MDKVYLAQLERFGYTLTAVGKTEKEAADAIIKEYIEIYRRENNSDPAKDKWGDRSYLQVAKSELYVEAMEFGKVMWF